MANETTDGSAVDPYAAPKAKVEDAAPADQAGTAYFPVSLLKLAVMCVTTFSIYEIYWFYKNWKNAQRLANVDANAPIRAFFYGITSYWLFQLMRDHAKGVDPALTIAAGPLAIAVLLLAAAANLPDPYWLLTFLSFLPLLRVQSAVNRVNRQLAPQADPNARFSGWNIAGALLGGLVVALAVLGLVAEA